MRNKMIWGLATLIILIVTGVFLSIKAEQKHTVDAHIAAAEKLITEGTYYEAILALKPLLINDKKSQSQEDALWLAHTLTLKWEQSILEDDSFVEAINEKIETLNQLGAVFDNIEINFGYRCGFLQQLIDRYPESARRPIAEYYLIQKNYPAPICVPGEGNILEELYAYVDKYKKTGRFEVYMACLDIAHIHHGLWAVLTYPDEPSAGGSMGQGYTSEDPEQDKKRAAAYKAEALKYYQKYHCNPHGLPDDDSYERLKKNEAFGWYFIVWGC